MRNNPDGSVEAVFQGEPDAVTAMVDWCRSGPRGAQVEGVEESDEPPGGLHGFRVR